MPNPFVSGRVPPALYEALENYCQQTGRSKSDVQIAALEAYLGVQVERPFSKQQSAENLVIPVENVLGLDERLATLERLIDERVEQRLSERLGKLTA